MYKKFLIILIAFLTSCCSDNCCKQYILLKDSDIFSEVLINEYNSNGEIIDNQILSFNRTSVLLESNPYTEKITVGLIENDIVYAWAQKVFYLEEDEINVIDLRKVYFKSHEPYVN